MMGREHIIVNSQLIDVRYACIDYTGNNEITLKKVYVGGKM